jgi:hypothetical protein
MAATWAGNTDLGATRLAADGPFADAKRADNIGLARAFIKCRQHWFM